MRRAGLRARGWAQEPTHVVIDSVGNPAEWFYTTSFDDSDDVLQRELDLRDRQVELGPRKPGDRPPSLGAIASAFLLAHDGPPAKR